MSWVIWVAIALAVVIGLLLVTLYNRLVRLRNRTENAWSQVDVQLRRRYDLIPNLVETVKGYASHEREVFENVTKARAAATAATGSPAEQAAAEGPLVSALRQLFAVRSDPFGLAIREQLELAIAHRLHGLEMLEELFVFRRSQRGEVDRSGGERDRRTGPCHQ